MGAKILEDMEQKVLFQKRKIEGILKKKQGQDAIIEIDNLLSQVFYSDPKGMTKEEKNIVYIEELEREVNNGGFSQFFMNTSGDYTMELLNALDEIGSTTFLDLVRKAVSPFPGASVPADSGARQKLLEELQTKNEAFWEELSQEFFKYEEDIYELMIKYIKSNIEKFR